MTSALLQSWIQHPEQLDRETLYALRMQLQRYPYCQTLRLLYLKNLYLLHDDTFGAELRNSVLYVTDRRALFYLIEGERYRLQPQLAPAAEGLAEEEPGVDRTLSLIDAFLASVPDEQPMPDTHPLTYTGDYTAFLLDEVSDAVEAPPLRGQALIDGFISQSVPDEQKNGQPSVAPSMEPQMAADALPMDENGEDEGFFTETLAKIYIKQHRYEKALAIIRKLSLNYPKKNAYFADQIRFLEKLIINAKSK